MRSIDIHRNTFTVEWRDDEDVGELTVSLGAPCQKAPLLLNRNRTCLSFLSNVGESKEVKPARSVKLYQNLP